MPATADTQMERIELGSEMRRRDTGQNEALGSLSMPIDPRLYVYIYY
jgi:hypothetical protein